MGVPFNFTCVGVGIYACSRCGFELFDSADKILPSHPPEHHKSTTNNYRPLFNKTLEPNSIIRLPSDSNVKIQIACGNCKTFLGFELTNTLPDIAATATVNHSTSIFDVPTSCLRFVASKKCSVPLSFLF